MHQYRILTEVPTIDEADLICSEENKIVGNFYVIKKEYFIYPVMRESWIFIARLEDKQYNTGYANNGSVITRYYFKDYVIISRNGINIENKPKYIPIHSPYTSYDPEQPGSRLFSTQFYPVRLSPVPYSVLRSVQLHAFDSVRLEIERKTSVPLHVLNHVVAEFI
jgi:hypothetical protein